MYRRFTIKKSKLPKEKPLQLPVLKVHDVPDVGCVIVGRVETGSIRPGIKVRAALFGGKMVMTCGICTVVSQFGIAKLVRL